MQYHRIKNSERAGIFDAISDGCLFSFSRIFLFFRHGWEIDFLRVRCLVIVSAGTDGYGFLQNLTELRQLAKRCGVRPRSGERQSERCDSSVK